VIERVATLQEVQTWYSLEDVAQMNEALDAWAEARRRLELAQQQKKG
jgi:hypothetical protein